MFKSDVRNVKVNERIKVNMGQYKSCWFYLEPQKLDDLHVEGRREQQNRFSVNRFHSRNPTYGALWLSLLSIKAPSVQQHVSFNLFIIAMDSLASYQLELLLYFRFKSFLFFTNLFFMCLLIYVTSSKLLTTISYYIFHIYILIIIDSTYMLMVNKLQ